MALSGSQLKNEIQVAIEEKINQYRYVDGDPDNPEQEGFPDNMDNDQIQIEMWKAVVSHIISNLVIKDISITITDDQVRNLASSDVASGHIDSLTLVMDQSGETGLVE